MQKNFSIFKLGWTWNSAIGWQAFIRCLLRIFAVLVMVTNLFGCRLVRIGLATLRSTAHFVALESDKRILYEPGAKEFARKVAGYLPEAVATVEKEQYRPFTKPVFVYVCATEESFARFTSVSKDIRGALIKKIFLSEKLWRQPESIKLILTHELSHLHLQQQIGWYNFSDNLPAWFKEGLATSVSNGGGAETVSETEARKAIIEGKHFIPETKDSLLFPKSGSSYGLKPHMFYRQSAMFVAYLKKLDETKFRAFLLALEDGKNFKKSFISIFGTSIDEIWQQFVQQLKGKI